MAPFREVCQYILMVNLMVFAGNQHLLALHFLVLKSPVSWCNLSEV